jgi:hypothetical protein
VISNGQTQTRSIVPAGDLDWIVFTLTQTSGVEIIVGGWIDPMSALVNERFWLYLYGPNSSTIILDSAEIVPR